MQCAKQRSKNQEVHSSKVDHPKFEFMNLLQEHLFIAERTIEVLICTQLIEPMILIFPSITGADGSLTSLTLIQSLDIWMKKAKQQSESEIRILISFTQWIRTTHHPFNIKD